MRHSTLLLTASVFAVAACSSNEASKGGGNSAYGGTFIYASVGDVVDPFPPFITEQNGRMLADLVFDRLARIRPDMNAIGDKGFDPELAKSWTWSPDSMSIAFSIDPKARWHDGKPVTASDVRYSFRVFNDPKTGSPATPLIENIDSVSVRDSSTAVVWFKKHTPTQFFDVAYQIMILPEHVYGSIPDDQLHTSPQTRQLVGSGQFRFVKWQPGVRLDLIADTANFRGRPKLDRVAMTPIADPNAGVAQVLTGTADYMQAFPADQVSKLDSSKVARRLDVPVLGTTFLAFNQVARKSRGAPNPLFGDVRVRRALSMAVDRRGMLSNVFGSSGRIAYGPFPAAAGYADTTLKLLPYDTTAAKALLDSAGWKVGANGIREKNGVPLKFSMTTPTTSLFRRRYAVLLQDAFKRVGAQADIDAVDAATFQNARLGNGDFDAIIGTFNPDPNVGGARQLWSTSAIGTTNWMHYSNKSVDALLDSAAASFDPAKAKAYASRAFQDVVNDAPAVWLYDIVFITAINRRIDVPKLNPDGWWLTLSDWSIPADKRLPRDKIGLGQATP
jgi:peptide/nickel transport system substrate-binding protein